MLRLIGLKLKLAKRNIQMYFYLMGYGFVTNLHGYQKGLAMKVLKKVVTTFQFVTKLWNPGLNHLSVTKRKRVKLWI